MSEKRRLFDRTSYWILGLIAGGALGLFAGDLDSWLFPDRWVAACETMLEEEWGAGHHLFFTDGELCVAIVYPELAGRELIRNDATDARHSAYGTVLDTHDAALRSSQGGEVRVRFRVDAGGAPVDPEVSESSGSAAVEAFALDLAKTMTFSAVATGEASNETWAEYPVSIGVRPRQ
ncbi:MAG: energy transducer TonB [Gemmatimonadota bacterium]|nr:energy transducer TonB [Gemmatimonadota bacterium]